VRTRKKRNAATDRLVVPKRRANNPNETDRTVGSVKNFAQVQKIESQNRDEIAVKNVDVIITNEETTVEIDTTLRVNDPDQEIVIEKSPLLHIIKCPVQPRLSSILASLKTAHPLTLIVAIQMEMISTKEILK